jgi:hypothetical protein
MVDHLEVNLLVRQVLVDHLEDHQQVDLEGLHLAKLR